MATVWQRFVGTMDGKFRPTEPERFRAMLQEFAGKEVEVCICQRRVKRTLPQNAYLNVLAREIARESGDTEDSVKQAAVLEAIGLEAGTRKVTLLGREFLVVRSTASLSKAEGSKVLDWMLDKAAFLDVRVPTEEQVEVMD
jgi:hypothetical protein